MYCISWPVAINSGRLHLAGGADGLSGPVTLRVFWESCRSDDDHDGRWNFTVLARIIRRRTSEKTHTLKFIDLILVTMTTELTDGTRNSVTNSTSRTANQLAFKEPGVSLPTLHKPAICPNLQQEISYQRISPIQRLI